MAVLEDERQDFSWCRLMMVRLVMKPFSLIDCAGSEELAAALRFILPESAALRRVRGLNRLLAGVRRGQQLVKLPITVQTSQQRVGKQIGVRTVVLFDGGLK